MGKTLTLLGKVIKINPLGFSLGAIVAAAGMAGVLSIFITISGIEHREESPPPVFQDSLTNR